jgi:hypothetical protein
LSQSYHINRKVIQNKLKSVWFTLSALFWGYPSHKQIKREDGNQFRSALKQITKKEQSIENKSKKPSTHKSLLDSWWVICMSPPSSHFLLWSLQIKSIEHSIKVNWQIWIVLSVCLFRLQNTISVISIS